MKLTGRHANIHAVIPPPPPKVLDVRPIYDRVVTAAEWIGRLDAAAGLLLQPRVITRTLERREAVLSSQIEGTQSTISDLLAYEATGSAEGAPSDVVVTRNYVSALDHGLRKIGEGGVASFGKELIRELHRILMAGADYRGQPGEFKTEPNWIGPPGYDITRATYVPAPPESVGECLDILVDYLRQDPAQSSLALSLRMAVAHAYFESVHPFPDGNGRVGRLLPPLMMAAEAHQPIYIAGYLKSRQDDYYEGLRLVQLKGDWYPWLSFFLEGLVFAAKESIEIANALIALKDKWMSALVGLRRDSAAYKAIDVLLGHPSMTIRSLARHLRVTFPAASAAVKALIERVT